MKRLILIFILFIAAAGTAAAQDAPYKFDFGVALGMSGYLGEANRSSLLHSPGFTAELNSRYIYDSRWAFRAVLGVISLKGNTADMDDVLPDMQNIKFSSTVVDFGVRGEFNFLPYGIGETYKALRRISPYITLGIGACVSLSDGTSAIAPTIPVGIGVKYKVSQRMNLSAEFTMTKAFGDKVDGKNLSDLNQIKTDFYKNTDWYSRLTIGFTYEFGERCTTCHYVD